MESFYNLINKVKDDLVIEIANFFRTYTVISYEPLNRPGDSVIIIGSDYKWNDLSDEGKREQSELYTKYLKFYKLIRVLSSNLPSRVLAELGRSFNYTENFLLQLKRPYETNSVEVINKVEIYINEQFKTLDSIAYKEKDRTIFVPDTNALLMNPNIEKWKFDSINSFQILLLPTVLSELDKLKISHQNQNLKDKANKIIKRIKEYRRRGKLTDGVVVTKHINLSALAVEPNFDKSLDWLDSNNNDDRIIASFIEVCRLNIRNEVCLVTLDINLQNKLEFANLQYAEPPENEYNTPHNSKS